MEQQRMAHIPKYKAPPDLDLIETQRDLQRIIRQHKPQAMGQGRASASVREHLRRVRFNEEAIRMEFAEMLDPLPWKEWKSYSLEEIEGPLPDDLRLEQLYELVDILHFILNIAISLGVSWEELKDAYYTKVRENIDRQERGY